MFGLVKRKRVYKEGELLTQSTGAASDGFGFSTALSEDGNTAIVGAWRDDIGATSEQGSATVFTRSGGVWTEQQTITQTGGAAADYFGYSVALSSDGNTAIVGAPGDDVGSNPNEGSATIFTRTSGTWTQQQTITRTGIPAGGIGDSFGHSVALSGDGNTAIVGAYLANWTYTDQGIAVVFTRSGGVWTQQQILTQTGGATNDALGISVALSDNGDTAIVGAHSDDVGANANQGSATIFTRSSGVWTQQQTITQTNGVASDLFGWSVALSNDGNTAIVGASNADVGANANQGSATIFTRSGTVWTEQQTITQPGGAADEYFGYSVALSSDGNIAIVGAYRDDIGANEAQGSATIFTRTGGVWKAQQKITQTGGAEYDFFGISVALSGNANTIIVGAYEDDIGGNANQGSATIFYRR